MMIQSVMLVALGFLAATILALIFAPALWARAVRLTTQRIRTSLPLTMNEIEADKDRLRADFAIQIRKFEVGLEKEKMKTARHLVDISRRDTEINRLNGKIDSVSRNLEEQENANRVYAQTISRRIPDLEAQLAKAKELLGIRYEEIAELRTSLSRQENKLGEAQTQSQMRKAELDRLRRVMGSKSPDEWQESLVRSEEMIQSLQGRNEALETEVTVLRDKVSDLTEQLNDRSEAIEAAVTEGATQAKSEAASSDLEETPSLAETEVGQVVKRLLTGFSSGSAAADSEGILAKAANDTSDTASDAQLSEEDKPLEARNSSAKPDDKAEDKSEDAVSEADSDDAATVEDAADKSETAVSSDTADGDDADKADSADEEPKADSSDSAKDGTDKDDSDDGGDRLAERLKQL